MSEDERKTIKKLSKCDFSEIHKYFVSKSEEKKNMSKEEKQVRIGIYIKISRCGKSIIYVVVF